MSNRFFLDSPITDREARLAGSEAHHLLHVMRAGIGTEIVLFDGTGVEYTARVEQTDRQSVGLTIIESREVDRELAFSLTLAAPLPKGDRTRWLVEKATELGVTRFVPLLTERTEQRPNAQAIVKLRRSVIEASKQCLRNRLMEIDEPCRWNDFLQNAEPAVHHLLAHPGGESLESIDLGTDEAITMAVGPEGGFTEDEVQKAQTAGWQVVDLGSRILRIETSAILLVSLAIARPV